MTLPALVPVAEVGGSHISAAMVDVSTGHVLVEGAARLPLAADGDAQAFVSTFERCARHLPVGRGQVWAVALPGPFDYAKGIALYQGVGKFEALYGLDLRDALSEALPGPPGHVVFLNDAHAFLWGEWHFGAARGYSRCVGLTLGTGIGSAFMDDGVIVQDGPRTPPEGRMDLVTVNGQRLEQFVSARAVVSRYRQVTGLSVATVVEVADRARQGDPRAVQVLEEAFVALGRALGPWLAAFGAEVVVAGGAMTGSWNLIGPAVSRGLSETGEGPAAALLTCTRGAEAALLGAAVFASQGQVMGRRSPGATADLSTGSIL